MSNPFQLRFDLLMAAEQRLVQKYHADLEKAKLTANDSKYILSSFLPKYPTDQEIFDLANAMKNFIENK